MPDKGNFAAVIETGDARTTHAVCYGVDSEFNAVQDGMGTLKREGQGGTQQFVAFAQNQAGEVRIDEVIPTIGTNSNASGRATPMIAFHPTQDPISSTDGSTHALGCGSSQGCATVAVAVDLHNHAISGDITATVTSAVGGTTSSGPSIMSGMSVRRLTPTECERLQGFPDGWTQIGTDEKPTADSHRYKQLGNAVTVNVAEWIARRTRTWLTK